MRWSGMGRCGFVAAAAVLLAASSNRPEKPPLIAGSEAEAIARAHADKFFPCVDTRAERSTCFHKGDAWMVKFLQVRNGWAGMLTVVVDERDRQVMIAYASPFDKQPNAPVKAR